MSLWSLNDGSALTGTMTFTNGDADVAGSSCSFESEVKVGDVIISAGGEKARVKSITDDDNLTLTANFSGSTETGVAATITRPPANFGISAPHIDDNILGVDEAEMTAGSDNIVSIEITDGGTGYASGATPTVTVSGNGTATATTSSGAVDALTLTSAGSSYTSVPTVTIAAPAALTFNGASAVDDTTEVITCGTHQFATGDEATYSDGGGTTIGGLTDGQTVFIIRESATEVKLASSRGDAFDGNAIDLTDGVGAAHTLTGVTATAAAQLGSTGITHAGWVKKTVGTGGRAGRVSYEVLVATNNITGDADDDASLPDS